MRYSVRMGGPEPFTCEWSDGDLPIFLSAKQIARFKAGLLVFSRWWSSTTDPTRRIISMRKLAEQPE